MPIKSYLAIAVQGQKEALQKDINQLKNCEATASENKDVLVVLTETANDKEDKKLFQKLNTLKNLQLLTLVSAFSQDTISTQN
mgnify:CR=1 FL=1